MQIHVLTGDALAELFSLSGIEGNTIISRECLIEGPVLGDGKDLSAFWQMRADYLTTDAPEEKEFYFEKVAKEFEKLLDLPAGSEINLWFEFDLFCQANMWFVLNLLKQFGKQQNIYRINPIIKEISKLWRGFGDLSVADLPICLAQKIPFSEKDIALGVQLWQAYSRQDAEALQALSQTNSPCFPYLREVCEAAIAKQEGAVEILVQNIIQAGASNFKDVFLRFSKENGIYGLGDLQVKNIYEQLVA
ncbi:MAG: hypothetical protein SFU99_07860 [Saprospiraceae bacterium]|nr:hypothetical protein [Saprospiraceae bacterium]